MHQPPAVRHQPYGVLEFERSGHVGRGDLAHAVADHRVGAHAPGLPEPGERDLDREHRGLGHVGGLHPGRVGVAQDVVQGPAGLGAQQLVDVVEGVADHGLALGEVEAHLRPLRALSGEDVDELGRTVGGPAAVGVGERRGEFGGVLADHGDPVLVMGAAHGGGRGEGGDRVGEPGGVVRGECAQSVGGGRGDQQGVRSGSGIGRGLGGRGLRRAAEDHVRVGAGEPERAHSGGQLTLVVGQPYVLHRDVRAGGLPVDHRRRVDVVDLARDRAVAQHQQRLEETGDTGGGVHVPEVRLVRADQQR